MKGPQTLGWTEKVVHFTREKGEDLPSPSREDTNICKIGKPFSAAGDGRPDALEALHAHGHGRAKLLRIERHAQLLEQPPEVRQLRIGHAAAGGDGPEIGNAKRSERRLPFGVALLEGADSEWPSSSADSA